MKLKSFLKLVEIQTKVASVIPYLLGLVYVLYNFKKLNAINMIIMFTAMIIFDMTVTALNNYYDYKKAVKKHGYNYEMHNSIVRYNLKPRTVLATIIIMCVISAALGILLVFMTNIMVMIIGGICFAIGIAYSFGPMPISRTPFGEVFSGFTMGLGIMFITVFINVYNQDFLNVYIENTNLFVNLDLHEVVGVIVASLPAVFCIANIMLANNICDIKDDIENKRHTLPIVIGKAKSLILLQILFYLSYAAIIAGVVMQVLPLYSLLTLLTLIFVVKKVKIFKENPTKKDTFGLIVACFVVINISLILTIVLGIIDASFIGLLA